MGVPTPNLFDGSMNFHGKKEYVPLEWMELAVETLLHLSDVWVEKNGGVHGGGGARSEAECEAKGDLSRAPSLLPEPDHEFRSPRAVHGVGQAPPAVAGEPGGQQPPGVRPRPTCRARARRSSSRRQRQRLCAAASEAIAARYGVSRDMVVTAQGTSGANFLVFAALVKAGDEVLVERPGYDPLMGPPLLLGATRHQVRPALRGGLSPRPRRGARGHDAADQAHRHHQRPQPHRASSPRRRTSTRWAGSPSGTARSSWLTRCISTPRSPGPVRPAAATSAGVPLHEQPHQELRPRRPALRLGDRASRRRRVGGARARHRGRHRRVPGRTAVRARVLRCWIGSRPAPGGSSRRTGARCARSWNRSPRSSTCGRRPGTVVFPRIRGVADAGPFVDRLAREFETDVVPGRFFQAPAHFRVGFGGRPEVLAEGLAQLGRALASA